jgi:hypothetical protein
MLRLVKVSVARSTFLSVCGWSKKRNISYLAEALPDSTGPIFVPVPIVQVLVLHAIYAKNIGSGATH